MKPNVAGIEAEQECVLHTIENQGQFRYQVMQDLWEFGLPPRSK